MSDGKPREFIAEFQELTELTDAHYFRDELQKDNEPYPSPKLARLFDLEQKYRGIDTKRMMISAVQKLQSQLEEAVSALEFYAKINENHQFIFDDEESSRAQIYECYKKSSIGTLGLHARTTLASLRKESK